MSDKTETTTLNSDGDFRVMLHYVGDGDSPPGTKIGTLLTNPTGDGRALVNALADEYDVVVDQVMPNGQMNLAILEEASADAE
jgi:hypothetical protein